MLTSDVECELMLSPQPLYGDNHDYSWSSALTSFFSSKSKLPSCNSGKHSKTSQDESQEILNLESSDILGSGMITLSPRNEDNEYLQSQSEIKSQEEKNSRKNDFSKDSSGKYLPHGSLPSLNIPAGSPQERKHVPAKLCKGKTQPNLLKRNNKHEYAMFFHPSQWSGRFGIQFFTVIIPKVTLIKGNERGPKGSTHAVYQLEIKRGRQIIVRKYNYKQFSDFHRALLRSSISIFLLQYRINLPAKTWFKNVSPSFLEQRRSELEKYLHQLLQFKYSPREALVQNFLALNEFQVLDFWIDH